MKEYPKNKKIEVDWVDIIQDPEWLEESKIDAEVCPLCHSLGYYYKHTKDFLYISSTISGSQRDVTIIPIGCVRKIRSLR